MAPVIEHRPRGFASVKNHPLSGITLPQWARLLYDHGDAIEYGRAWQRVATCLLTLVTRYRELRKRGFSCV
jgi:hypothetical protein